LKHEPYLDIVEKPIASSHFDLYLHSLHYVRTVVVKRRQN